MLVHTISAVTLSAFANMPDDDRRRDEFCGSLRFTSAITAPAFAGMAATAPEIVHVILGDRWAAAAPILSALSLSGYLLSLGIIATSVLLVVKRSHLDSLSSAVAAVANIVIFLAVIRFGPVALAITVSITALLLVPVRLGFALHALGGKWRDAWRALLPSLSATCIMLGGLLIVRAILPAGQLAVVDLAALSATGALLYLGALRLVSKTLFELVLGAVGVARFHRAAVAPAE
jgi:O-antigen/teichoic acid export membrane protein